MPFSNFLNSTDIRFQKSISRSVSFLPVTMPLTTKRSGRPSRSASTKTHPHDQEVSQTSATSDVRSKRSSAEVAEERGAARERREAPPDERPARASRETAASGTAGRAGTSSAGRSSSTRRSRAGRRRRSRRPRRPSRSRDRARRPVFATFAKRPVALVVEIGVVAEVVGDVEVGPAVAVEVRRTRAPGPSPCRRSSTPPSRR